MSLWKVADAQTAELMQQFYRHLLAGECRFEALRAAQMAVRIIHPNPIYWGAFICQGDFSPLFSR
jgi:CHAT domain-containing protein